MICSFVASDMSKALKPISVIWDAPLNDTPSVPAFFIFFRVFFWEYFSKFGFLYSFKAIFSCYFKSVF